jgi:hypothetical protein
LRHALSELRDPAREVAEVLPCGVRSEPERGEGVGADPGLDREVAQLVASVGDILPQAEERPPGDGCGAKSCRDCSRGAGHSCRDRPGGLLRELLLLFCGPPTKPLLVLDPLLLLIDHTLRGLRGGFVGHAGDFCHFRLIPSGIGDDRHRDIALHGAHRRPIPSRMSS